MTQVLDRSEPDALRDHVRPLSAAVARFRHSEPAVLPPGGSPTHTVELATHAGHFLDRARNYLVVFEADDGAYMRAVGNWDPTPWYVRGSRCPACLLGL